MTDRLAGDGRTRDQFVARYEGLVWDAVNKAALRFDAKPEDVEDAYVEAWARILSKIDHYSTDRGTLSGFLWTVAYRRALSFFQRAVDRHPAALAQEPATDEWDMAEESMDVFDCLSRLDVGQTEIVARWGAGNKGRELGEGVGLDTARTFRYRYRALDAVRRCMQEKGYAV